VTNGAYITPMTAGFGREIKGTARSLGPETARGVYVL